jgi:hypothetical protein
MPVSPCTKCGKPTNPDGNTFYTAAHGTVPEALSVSRGRVICPTCTEACYRITPQPGDRRALSRWTAGVRTSIAGPQLPQETWNGVGWCDVTFRGAYESPMDITASSMFGPWPPTALTMDQLRALYRITTD